MVRETRMKKRLKGVYAIEIRYLDFKSMAVRRRGKFISNYLLYTERDQRNF